jgi:hypothetical protein
MKLCVAHLVRKQNGVEPVRRFVESYVQYSAGVDHELVLLLKGFDRAENAASVLEAAGDAAASSLFLPDVGYDVGAYFSAVRELPHDVFCFVNSFSRILADGWLRSLVGPLDDGGVGAVAATGSWASSRTFWVWALGLPSAYDELTPERPSRSVVRERLGAAHRLLRTWPHHAPFPAPHLRTNAFAAQRAVLERIRVGAIATKDDAYRFESGSRGLTPQVLAMGLEVLVAGRDGMTYARDEWWKSNTLWQRQQENLLVADNQTEDYRRSDFRRRKNLSVFAWGPRAAPEPPPDTVAAR